MRAAGKLYQKTYKGRMNNAKRQERYRRKKSIKVTHQGSKELPTNDLLRFAINNEDLKIIDGDKLRCHFCGCSCSRLLRTSPLARDKTFTPGVWPRGP